MWALCAHCIGVHGGVICASGRRAASLFVQCGRSGVWRVVVASCGECLVDVVVLSARGVAPAGGCRRSAIWMWARPTTVRAGARRMYT